MSPTQNYAITLPLITSPCSTGPLKGATVADMFPERPLWRDVDRVKGTPHMNWGSCSCSQCCIWRIVARLEAALAGAGSGAGSTQDGDET